MLCARETTHYICYVVISPKAEIEDIFVHLSQCDIFSPINNKIIKK